MNANAPNSHEALASQIISSNLYLSLATINEDGRPTVCAVYFAHGPDYKLYCVCSVNSRHHQNMIRDPNVATIVFDSRQPPSTGDGVQMEGRARLLSGDEIEPALRIYYVKRFPNPKERQQNQPDATNFAKPSIWRLWEITPKQWWVKDKTYKTEDKKIEVKLANGQSNVMS